MTDELERRLRSALTSMAEEVSPSHQAWAEHQRRLASKSRRHRFRPAVMAAVAAAAAVLIAAPIMIVQQVNSPVNPGALPVASRPSSDGWQTLPPAPTATRTATVYRRTEGEVLLSDPIVVSSQNLDTRYVYMYAYIIEMPSKDRLLCTVNAPSDEPINGPNQSTYGKPICLPLTAPKPGRYEWGRRQIQVPNVKGAWVYVMNAPAHRLIVRRGDDDGGNPYVAAQRSGNAELGLFLVYTNSVKPPKAYTLYNSADQDFFNGE